MRYDSRRPFRHRADHAPPDQSLRIDSPCWPPHPWAGRASLGENPDAGLPLFKEVEAAINDRRVAAKAVETYERISTAFAAEQATLDGLQGGRDDGRSLSTARVQVYLSDRRVFAALDREARQAGVSRSQAAGRAMVRNLARSLPADPDDRLLHLDRALRDHMRSTARDMQIVQELVIELARAFFLRLPDAAIDDDPLVRAAMKARSSACWTRRRRV